MKAMVFDGPGRMPVRERHEPVAGPGDVVVEVRAAGVCGSDVHGYTGASGRRTPGIVMGHEAAGVVQAVGDGVTSVASGDRVVIGSIMSCGRCGPCLAGGSNVCVQRRLVGIHVDGAYAERVVVPDRVLLRIPDALSFEAAALTEPLAIAMHAVHLAEAARRDRVVIIGSGPIGLLILAMLRSGDAGTITVVDRSRHRLDAALALGADAARRVGAHDAGPDAHAMEAGAAATLVFEAVGIGDTLVQAIAWAGASAHVICVGNATPMLDLPIQEVVSRELTVRGSYGYDTEFEPAAEHLAAGRIDAAALIERRAPLAEGPTIFGDLADGRLEAIKVVLHPMGG
jgi:L-iditol 2-dehydrogenase